MLSESWVNITCLCRFLVPHLDGHSYLNSWFYIIYLLVYVKND